MSLLEPLELLDEEDELLLALALLLFNVIDPAPLAIDTAVVPESEAAVLWATVPDARSVMSDARVRRRIMSSVS